MSAFGRDAGGVRGGVAAIPAEAMSARSMTIEGFERLLRARHSCRSFVSRPVEDRTIGRILAAAQSTPSWCNCQPWKVVVTRPQATTRFSEALLSHARTSQQCPDIAFPREYTGIYKERRRECGWLLYEAVGVSRGDRLASSRQAEENYRLFGAPHVAIVTCDSTLGPYASVDCGGYVAMFLLAAQSLGVATVPQAALATYSPFVRAHFNIPQQQTIVCGISFGYEDETHPANGFRTCRAPLDEVATWMD
jgi:nitroreductase